MEMNNIWLCCPPASCQHHGVSRLYKYGWPRCRIYLQNHFLQVILHLESPSLRSETAVYILNPAEPKKTLIFNFLSFFFLHGDSTTQTPWRPIVVLSPIKCKQSSTIPFLRECRVKQKWSCHTLVQAAISSWPTSLCAPRQPRQLAKLLDSGYIKGSHEECNLPDFNQMT